MARRDAHDRWRLTVAFRAAKEWWMIAWEWLDRPGLEVLDLAVKADGVRAQGVVVAELEGIAVRLRYRLACDPGWRFRAAEIALGDGDARRVCVVTCTPGGEWSVDGAARPDLSGCEDIDIMATPFTNTLPIRRLDPQGAVALRVAHVRLPGLDVRAVAQEYAPLGPGRFRYRNLDSGFAAE
jgi:hypothetical protein